VIDVRQWPTVLWREWLLAYLPISLAGFAAILGRRPRSPTFGSTARESWLFVAAIGAWVGSSAALISSVDEKGAYFAALAFPAAWFAVHAVPRRWQPALISIAAAMSLWFFTHPNRPAWNPRFASGVIAVSTQKPSFVVLGTLSEVDAVVVTDPTRLVQLLDDWVYEILRQGGVGPEKVAVAFDALLNGLASLGARLVLADSAVQAMLGSNLPALRWLGAEVLPRFECTAIVVDDFHGVVVSRRTEPR
ncbi:MAG: hypothetical protein ABIP94_10955, partial [Planctomycetota bacterium]